MAKQSYTVLSHVDHDGRGYPAGKPIQLDEEHAEPLLAAKAIEPAKAEPEKKPAK